MCDFISWIEYKGEVLSSRKRAETTEEEHYKASWHQYRTT